MWSRRRAQTCHLAYCSIFSGKTQYIYSNMAKHHCSELAQKKSGSLWEVIKMLIMLVTSALPVLHFLDLKAVSLFCKCCQKGLRHRHRYVPSAFWRSFIRSCWTSSTEHSANPAARVGHYTRTISTSTQKRIYLVTDSCSAEWQCLSCPLCINWLTYLLTQAVYSIRYCVNKFQYMIMDAYTKGLKTECICHCSTSGRGMKSSII